MRRVTDDRGAALVEAAITTPLVLLLVFGLVEMASLLRSYSTSQGSVRAGGRVASVAGADPLTDYAVLRRIYRERIGFGVDEIEYLIVWHATGPGDEVPEDCIPESITEPNVASAGVSDGGVDLVGACNVYVRPDAPGGAFERAMAEDGAESFGCQGLDDPDAGTKLDCAWPGKNRRVLTTPRDVVGPVTPSDFVGVHMLVRHRWFTGIMGDPVGVSTTAIHLIEPQGYSF